MRKVLLLSIAAVFALAQIPAFAEETQTAPAAGTGMETAPAAPGEASALPPTTVKKKKGKKKAKKVKKVMESMGDPAMGGAVHKDEMPKDGAQGAGTETH